MQCRLTTDTRLCLVVTPILVFCSESASFHLIQWLLGWMDDFISFSHVCGGMLGQLIAGIRLYIYFCVLNVLCW